MKNDPLVSIVIPTLNSEKTLEKCLVSIRDQTYQNYEIIVVDACSKDKTTEIASKFNVKIISSDTPSMTKQTNKGIINSKGDYIYRMDSDVILPPTIIEESVVRCEKHEFDGACIFWIPDESISFWAKVRKIEKESYVKYPNYIGSTKYDKNILGARFLKRNVLKDVEYFNEEIKTSGEDYALYNKLAKTDYKFALIESREKHIGEPKTLMDIFKKNFNYGKALNLFLKSQKKEKYQFSPIGRKYLFDAFKNALNKNMTLFFGLIIYLSTVYFSAFTGMVYSKIYRYD